MSVSTEKQQEGEVDAKSSIVRRFGDLIPAAAIGASLCIVSSLCCHGAGADFSTVVHLNSPLRFSRGNVC